MTIILWYFATGILTGITIAMNKYVPPGPNQIYSQGYWHAVIASCLYMFCSMILMVNMLGYFLGHYPQHFTLTDEQRNLILQSIMFFIWLAGGAEIFVQTNDMNYPDAVYFCDVTILTLGFGDFYPVNDVSRGLIFPYSVGGIIILGLMVSSIHKFANELSQDKIIKKHLNRKRVSTFSRVVNSSQELEEQQMHRKLDLRPGHRPTISPPVEAHSMYDAEGRLNSPAWTHDQSPSSRAVTFLDGPNRIDGVDNDPDPRRFLKRASRRGPMYRTMRAVTAPIRVPMHMMTRPMRRMVRAQTNKNKLIIMREEKDRFDAMRKIQKNIRTWKRWWALTMSVIAFSTLWCAGAVVFWQAEQRTQALSYFEALYFCYVSLLTIGYGDLSPRSNAGKAFFVVWSLIAVPTMTILISDMGDTVIDGFKQATFKLADWTILPKKGIYSAFVKRNPWLWNWLQKNQEKKKLRAGFKVGPEESNRDLPTLDELAKVEACSEAELSRRLAFAIRHTADDLQNSTNKRYTYEEWVEFTRLIRFTTVGTEALEHDEEKHGVVEWDWIGEDSPMLSEQTETEWVLDRLCESLLRLLQRDIIKVRPEIEAQDEEVLAEEIASEHGDNEATAVVPEKPQQQHHDNDKHDESPSSPQPQQQNDTEEEPLYRSIDDVVESAEERAARHSDERRRETQTHPQQHPQIEPRHRGVGLFPELDTTDDHDKRSTNSEGISPSSTRRPSHDVFSPAYKRRHSGFSAMSGGAMSDTGTSTTSGRRPSRRSRSISRGPTPRKGPFSRPPQTR